MTQLSDHFALEEFMRPGVPEDYPAELVDTKLRPLVDRLEWIRGLAGVPLRPTSAYRSPAHNAVVGGVNDSQHMDGDAADAVALLVPVRVLAERIQASIDNGTAPAFGEVIVYGDRGHVHISNPAARLGDRNGTALFSPGLDSDGKRTYTPLADALAAHRVPLLSQPQTREGLLARSLYFSLARSSSSSPSGVPGGKA